MWKVYILSFILFSTFAKAQDTWFPDNLAVSGALRNTFWLKTDSFTASSFIVVQNGIELLITARHVFKNKDSKKNFVNFELNIKKEWKRFEAKIYFSEDSNIDIAVLKLKSNIENTSPLEIAKPTEVWVGQGCVFLGFPYGIFYSPANDEFLPFVKKALISSFREKITYLDGLNNPGFSGGPVIIWSYETKKPKLYAVISGYYPQKDKLEIPLLKKKGSFNYIENSGIIYSYPLSDIEKIMSQIKEK
jgi:hypothetical protein